MMDEASAEGVRGRPTEISSGKNAVVGTGVVTVIDRMSKAEWNDDSNMVG
jgi:hypothetical protein